MDHILRRLLFPVPKRSYGWDSMKEELICIVGRNDEIVPCSLLVASEANLEPNERFLSNPGDSQDGAATCIMICCHANGEDIGMLYKCSKWMARALGVHMLVPEYPGYGLADGIPDEAAICNNVKTIYDFALHGLKWDPSKILIFGRSIGTGPAVQLASEVECGGLVLMSPFTSVKDIVRKHGGMLAGLIDDGPGSLAGSFPSESTIASVQAPVIIVHGDMDIVIPVEQGRRLASCAASSCSVHLAVVEGVAHSGPELYYVAVAESIRLLQLRGNARTMNISEMMEKAAEKEWCKPTLAPGETPYILQTERKGFIFDPGNPGDLSMVGTFVNDEVLAAQLAPSSTSTQENTFNQWITDSEEGIMLTDEVFNEQLYQMSETSKAVPSHPHPATHPLAASENGYPRVVDQRHLSQKSVNLSPPLNGISDTDTARSSFTAQSTSTSKHEGSNGYSPPLLPSADNHWNHENNQPSGDDTPTRRRGVKIAHGPPAAAHASSHDTDIIRFLTSTSLSGPPRDPPRTSYSSESTTTHQPATAQTTSYLDEPTATHHQQAPAAQTHARGAGGKPSSPFGSPHGGRRKAALAVSPAATERAAAGGMRRHAYTGPLPPQVPRSSIIASPPPAAVTSPSGGDLRPSDLFPHSPAASPAELPAAAGAAAAAASTGWSFPNGHMPQPPAARDAAAAHGRPAAAGEQPSVAHQGLQLGRGGEGQSSPERWSAFSAVGRHVGPMQ